LTGYRRGVSQMVPCECGRFHYGRYGAAGLVLSNDAGEVLLARRSVYVHRPGTWAFPGGALDRGESAEECAVREADEELGIRRSAIVVTRTVPGLDHGVWRYTYVMANVAPDAPTIRLSLSWETDDAAWVPLHGVAALTLHPDLQVAWPDLLATW
jgi:8-oxo-dGTP diphosphatase